MERTPVEELLIEYGIQPTAQRCVVTGYLLETDIHPTAEEVIRAVKDSLPCSLSRATVYNTLNLLVEKGLLQELSTEPGQIRYDANTGHHHHFVDRESGRVYDLEIDRDGISISGFELPAEYKADHFKITFYGKVES
ncbi:MAG: transcriptional repressor [Candidatus Obscuribacterales bacterium]|nr:transcriptional repressor [Cyanobacteria bacterium HKST-UBA01]MCB9470049.1 transcriptional repressor [Candidatus Obscuribacterales bacterium]